jgi:hypothetical protein
MKTDVFTVTQNGKQTVSFLAQALGLMADLDIGTDHLRWMGSKRFVYGFVRGREYKSFCNPDRSPDPLNTFSRYFQALSYSTVYQGRSTG